MGTLLPSRRDISVLPDLFHFIQIYQITVMAAAKLSGGQLPFHLRKRDRKTPCLSRLQMNQYVVVKTLHIYDLRQQQADRLSVVPQYHCFRLMIQFPVSTQRTGENLSLHRL